MDPKWTPARAPENIGRGDAAEIPVLVESPLGSCVFPTVGTANPTLTIAALTLRPVSALARTLADVPREAVAI